MPIKHLKIAALSIAFLTLFSCKKEALYPVSKIECDLDYSSNVNHEKYQSILDTYAQKGITGLTVVISTPEEGYWIGSSGYASIEENQKMIPCHLHHTASLAKSFTGIVILQLIDEGKLQLNDPISPYLSDEVNGYIPNVEKLTIQHLLQQTSGIPEVFDVSFFQTLMNEPEQTYTTLDFLKMIDGRPAAFEPGEKHQYSDLNFNILGLIIDQIEGDHILSFSTRIFEPLGLENMYYHNKTYPEPDGLVASYWDQYNNGQIENISELQIRITNYILASDGIIASPQDMVRFYEAVFNGELLSEEMLDLIQSTPVAETETLRMNTGYSHGFMTIDSEEGPWIGHTGSHIGSSCYVYKNQESDAMIGVFTNTGVHFFTEKMQLIYNDLWNDLKSAVN